MMVVTRVNRVKSTSNQNSMHPAPLKIPKVAMGTEEGGLPKAISKIYRHIFAGGTLDQLSHEDIIILVLNPEVKNGTVKRKSAGTLYSRTIVYIDTRTGDMEFKTPQSWGRMDLTEITDALDELEKYKLI